MYQLEKCILVTNNDRAAETYKDQMKQVYLLDSYEQVLIKARDLIHSHHKLLTHPQASSLKPNQTPYRSILLYQEGDGDQIKDMTYIEKAIEVFQKWDEIKKLPQYSEKVAYDYKTIDLSMIENVVPRL